MLIWERVKDEELAFFCNLHLLPASECACLPVDELDFDPYSTRLLPVAFVPRLVKAIIDGDKTETRRIVSGIDHKAETNASAILIDRHCPYGPAGSRLWVREHFAAMAVRSKVKAGLQQTYLEECSIRDADLVVFKDNAIKWKSGAYEAGHRFGTIPVKRWRPPMHLPRWGGRLLLKVNSIAVERVQDITEAAAWAEGMTWEEIPGKGLMFRHPIETGRVTKSATLMFEWLWDSINGGREDPLSKLPMNWEFNPWVWVIKFERVL